MLDELVATYPMTPKKLGDISPLPSEGQRIITGRYQTSLSKTIIGEERFNLEKIANDRLVIFSRSIVNAPPRLDSFLMRLELGSSWNESLVFESERLEGRGRAKIRKNMRTVEITAKMPRQEEIHLERDVAEDAVLGCPFVSAYFAINNRISSLGIGQKTALHMLRIEVDPEFDIVEAMLNLERKDVIERKEGNGELLHAYAIKDTRRNSSFEGKLVMDEHGRPVSFESEGQMGSLQVNLIP
jgi:hypothetical protein